jgi:hypothetical protein
MQLSIIQIMNWKGCGRTGHDLIQGAIPVFALKDSENQENLQPE